VEWESVLDESIRYMEAHLLSHHSPDDVARHVHLSAIYLQQAFHIMTGLSLGEYMRNRRMHLAAVDLVTTQDKIIDIAYKYGYETPESFTKAFVRFHHAPPRLVRKHPSLARVFLPIDIHIYILGGDHPSPDLRTSGACRVHIPHRDDPLPLFPVSVAGRAVHR